MTKTYTKGQKIKFLSPHNQKLDGEVYDSNEYAIVVINPIFGQFVIDHKDVIHDIGELKSYHSDDEFEYYAMYSGGNPKQHNYSVSNNYGGGFTYLSPDVDDDGC